jgi:hypothetical protein
MSSADHLRRQAAHRRCCWTLGALPKNQRNSGFRVLAGFIQDENRFDDIK